MATSPVLLETGTARPSAPTHRLHLPGSPSASAALRSPVSDGGGSANSRSAVVPTSSPSLYPVSSRAAGFAISMTPAVLVTITASVMLSITAVLKEVATWVIRSCRVTA